MVVHDRGDFIDGIECAGIDVAELGTDNERSAQIGHRVAEGVGRMRPGPSVAILMTRERRRPSI